MGVSKNEPRTINSDDRCFLTAWVMSKSVIAFEHDRPKPNLSKRKGIYPF